MACMKREPIEELDYEGREVYAPLEEEDIWKIQEPSIEGVVVLFTLW